MVNVGDFKRLTFGFGWIVFTLALLFRMDDVFFGGVWAGFTAYDATHGRMCTEKGKVMGKFLIIIKISFN